MEVLARYLERGRAPDRRARAGPRRPGGAGRASTRVARRTCSAPGPAATAGRVQALRRRPDRARPRASTRRCASGWPAACRRSSTAPRRCRSRCRSTRRARSTSRAPAGCSSSPTRARACGGLERYGHVSTAYVAGDPRGPLRRMRSRRRPDVPQLLRALEVRGRAAGALARRAAVHDPAAEHRRRRPPQRLDVGLQRPLLAAAGVRARAVHGRAGDPVGAGRRRLGRLRRRRHPRAVRGRRRRSARPTTSPPAPTRARSARSRSWPAATSAGRCRRSCRRRSSPRWPAGAARGVRARGRPRLLPVLLDRDGVRRRRRRGPGWSRRGSAPRRWATTWSGCWTSPPAAGGASARSPASTRCVASAPLDGDLASRQSGCALPTRGVVAARRLPARAAGHAGRMVACSPIRRAFVPTTPTRSWPPRWPARSACAARTSLGGGARGLRSVRRMPVPSMRGAVAGVPGARAGAAVRADGRPALARSARAERMSIRVSAGRRRAPAPASASTRSSCSSRCCRSRSPARPVGRRSTTACARRCAGWRGCAGR